MIMTALGIKYDHGKECHNVVKEKLKSGKWHLTIAEIAAVVTRKIRNHTEPIQAAEESGC